MDLKISKEALVNGIQLVQNAVSQKSSLPILNNILLDTADNSLTLTATDLDIGICATIPVVMENPGSITVPARKFFDIIKALPDGTDVIMSMKKNNFVTIKSGKANFKIIGLPKEEFPQLPIFEDRDSITVEQASLKEMLNLTDFAASKDDSRYVLNGILLSVKGDLLTLVATDGRRLAMIEKKLPQKTLLDREGIIPIKTTQEVKKILGDDGDVVVKFGDNQIMFSFEKCFILSRLIKGDYPHYKNVIPEISKKKVIVSRTEFLDATRRASIFTDQESMAVKVSKRKKRFTISNNTPYLGEAKEALDIDYTGEEDIDIGFNPRYLIDVLKSLNDETVELEVNDANKPGVVRKGSEYIYVVLPMQLTPS